MKYKTRGNASPQGKPRVYFTGHPADVKQHFERITDAVLKLHNCAIFYDEDPEHPEDGENFLSDLDRMQLIVVVVTSRYVYGDTFAHNTVFRHAMERHIPVLPILEEGGIEQDFDKKCGNLQCLNPNARDNTAISFEDKLKKFLDSVLVGDELATRVRAAFDAYVFLSYRKKDRRYAQQLMRLIHQNPFCRDIAIWYDEFLVPGEDFNDAIRKAMEKSELFALVVTPNLLEDSNYIMSTEYPAAREAGKPILPAMLVPTDGGELASRYEDIPTPVDPAEEGALPAALRGALAAVIAPENDDEPQHIFFIGLAYLSGIDVEVNYEFAVQLITRAAEAGLPEAMEKLVFMYRVGEGVERDYHTAIRWQEKLAEARRAAYEADPTELGGLLWFETLVLLCDFWYELRQLARAGKACREMLEACRILDSVYHTSRTRRNLVVCYDRLSDISRAQGDLAGARAFSEKALAVSEQLAAETSTVLAREDLALNYTKLSRISREQGDLAGAGVFCEKGLVIHEQLAAETGTVEARRDLSISYHELGDISYGQGDLTGAKVSYEKGFAILERLALETGFLSAWRDLSVGYDKLGSISYRQGDLAGAKASYEQDLAISKWLAAEMGTVQAWESLSACYDRLGMISQEKGDLAGARAFLEKSLAIREQLATETDSVKVRRDLSAGYGRLGDISDAQGDLAGAKVFYEKSLAISERLMAEVGSAEMRRELVISYGRLGVINQMLGDLAGAKVFFEKSLAVHEQLAVETDTVEVWRNLADHYDKLSNIRWAQGYLSGAMDFYGKSLAIRERLAAQTDTVEARRDLSVSYDKLGNIRWAQGDLNGAMAFYGKCLAIWERLAAETGTVEARRDLAVSYDRLGDISREQGDLAGARTCYEKSFAIFEQLVSETDTLEVRQSLSISCNKLGNISREQGDLAGAKAFFEKDIAISERLAEEVGTAEAYDDLAVSYYKLSQTVPKRMFQSIRRKKEQQEYLRKAEAIWSRLATQYPDVSSYKERLAIVRKYIK